MCRIQSNLHMGERLISATVESPEESLGCHTRVHAVLGAHDVGRSDSWQSPRQTEGKRDVTRYRPSEPFGWTFRRGADTSTLLYAKPQECELSCGSLL